MIAGLTVAAIVAGGLGSVIRYLVTLAIAGREPLPWAVLVVNVVGSALGGVLLGLSEAALIDDGLRLILLSGLAGGLTTFSTFSVETLQLVSAGKWRSAIVTVLANLVLGIAAASLAYALTR